MKIFFLWFEADEISFKNMKKTVIFLIFADIQRHNFKYTGRLLGLWASECCQFYSKIFLPWRTTVTVVPSFKLIKHILPPPEKIRWPKKII